MSSSGEGNINAIALGSIRPGVFCPECQRLGGKSKVLVGASDRTLLWSTPYYDEDGQYHNHDSNITTTVYTCSKGHEFIRKSKVLPCWCGWPDELEPIVDADG